MCFVAVAAALIAVLQQAIVVATHEVQQHSAQPWPNRRIYYAISDKFPTNSHTSIRRAMDEIERKTCVKFVARRGAERDYIDIVPSEVCAAPVGYVPGHQHFRLSVECSKDRPVLLHELMHTLGLFHEHSRPDRDKYIKVNYRNIDRKDYAQFHKYRSILDLKGVAYDYFSILHYGPYKRSKNGKAAISPKRSATRTIGSKGVLTKLDVQKVRKLYQCSQRHFAPKEQCFDMSNECHMMRSKCELDAEVRHLCRKTCHTCGGAAAFARALSQLGRLRTRS